MLNSVGIGVITICLTTVGDLGIHGAFLKIAEMQSNKTALEQQQEDHLDSTDRNVSGIEHRIDLLEAERAVRRLENQKWRDEKDVEITELRLELSSVKGIAYGAFVALGVLQGIGLIRTFKKNP